jgi:hypothetical protein
VRRPDDRSRYARCAEARPVRLMSQLNRPIAARPVAARGRAPGSGVGANSAMVSGLVR